MNTLVALCAIGAEKVLANELKLAGFKTIPSERQVFGRVLFKPNVDESQSQGDAELLQAVIRANFNLRTADRVYVELARTHCDNFDALFDAVYSIDWQQWFKKDVKVVVDKVRTYASALSSEHSVQSVVHKALYEKLMHTWRMSSLPESGDGATVRIYIERNELSVLLDTSGYPLHRRGYRTSGGEAPIRETLAATLLQLAQWKRKTPLHDAFCGSGTIPIEALLYAYNIAPGLGRVFSYEKLVPFCSKEALLLRKEEYARAAQQIRPDCVVRVTGSDKNPDVLIHARANAERACVIAGKALQEIGSDARIVRPDFAEASFDELAAPYPEGLLLSNPPWGERLSDAEEAKLLYASMKSLFADFPNWNFGFISSHENFETSLGKKAIKTKALKSGNLDTVFYWYES